MFALTAAALVQIARAAAEQPCDGPPMLRVAAKLDEKDGEPIYGMGFDDEREDDLVLECSGVAVLISPRSRPLLDHTTLDFSEVHPGEFQFVFRCTDTCGSCRGDCS